MALTGKVCLVTGASRGIGKGIAVQLGEAGATVYITGEANCFDDTSQMLLLFFLLTFNVQGFFMCKKSRFDLLHTKQVNSSLFTFDAST